jgi:transposase
MSLTVKERRKEILLHYWKNGVRSVPKLCRLTKLPASTIRYNVKKIEETGSIGHRGGNGRTKKITGYVAQTVGQYIRRDTTLSLRTIATKLEINSVKVSYRTVGRYLKSIGYMKKRALTTPMLTEQQKKNRVEWAKRHINDNWETTLFTDETAFQLFRNTLSHWSKGKRMIRPRPKDRRKIFAWGGFCLRGKTSLFCFQRIMDGPFYVEILQQHIRQVNRMLGRQWRFQQDNDPKHTSRVAKAFLAENVPELMDWPSCSPDLNPIENIWYIVKHHVEKRMPKNLAELERFMVEEWNSVPEIIILNLLNSMKRRCELVIENNGLVIDF